MVAISPHLKLALAWLSFIDTKDLNGMASILSDNFLWTGRPVTLGIPPMGKQQYITSFKAAPFRYFNPSPGCPLDASYAG